MSVNAMATEDVYALLNVLHSQATGHSGVVATNLEDFTSMATETLQAGTDTVYSTLMQTIGRTIFSSRPYRPKFGGIEADAGRWGGITRKISIADRVAPAESAYHPTDGAAVDQYTIRKNDVVEMRYYGTDVYQDWFTVFEDQLINAFSGPEQLGSFVALQTQEMTNKWEQYREELIRSNLVNFIAAKNSINNGIIHLLTEYNTLTGITPALTAQTVWQPGNVEPFFRWVRARINTLSRMMTERSGAFQQTLTGKALSRHTPYENQKIYLQADCLDMIDAMVNTVTYHNEPLAYADVESVTYWQGIQDPMEINATAVYLKGDGTLDTTTAQNLTSVFGMMFDEDAIAYNLKDWKIANSPFNARGRYWNTFLTVNIQLMQDLTEKGIILLLD